MTTDTPLTPYNPTLQQMRNAAEVYIETFAAVGVETQLEQAALAFARHVLATVKADGHLPADAEWFAGLDGVLSKDGNYVHFKAGNLYGVALTVSKGVKVDIGPDDDSSRWWCWNPTRGQVHLACRLMGYTLNEGG